MNAVEISMNQITRHFKRRATINYFQLEMDFFITYKSEWNQVLWRKPLLVFPYVISI